MVDLTRTKDMLTFNIQQFEGRLEHFTAVGDEKEVGHTERHLAMLRACLTEVENAEKASAE